ncbi:UNVERIFIED_CONTAM: hypothetical protein K2H54_034151, partial [Gekko kuhli]
MSTEQKGQFQYSGFSLQQKMLVLGQCHIITVHMNTFAIMEKGQSYSRVMELNSALLHIVNLLSCPVALQHCSAGKEERRRKGGLGGTETAIVLHKEKEEELALWVVAASAAGTAPAGSAAHALCAGVGRQASEAAPGGRHLGPQWDWGLSSAGPGLGRGRVVEAPLLQPAAALQATIDLVVGYEPPAGPPNPNDPGGTNTQSTEDGEEDGGDEDVADGGTGGLSQGGPSGTHEVQLARRITKGKKTRRALSNKPQDFQIRVRVIEGRQLCGNNIKPVVKVHICGQTHRTRIKRGNNPYFDEIFFYNIHMTPSELFDETISIRVYDSYSLRADSLMGEFKIDIGYVYDEPGHAVMRKWLLLNDPEDTNSGAKGYLKVSMFVLGTGDEPPFCLLSYSPLCRHSISLPWPASMPFQVDDAFAQTVKEIFGADADKKNLVDPFVEVCFAGKKVCTNIIEKNANPEWNQLINLQIKFPSMCEKIRLTVYDWDRLTKNDTVGTTYLSLSRIAASGGEVEANTGETEVGFLPTFGPCYLNLYGSPREYTGFPDPYDELNSGKGEGVAYRGRILVELCTLLDSKPLSKKIETIPSDDILVVEKYQRRRKYSLSAVFHSATMLQDIGEAIQFEVSIGNYGNKFDTTCKPLASTTQYSRAIFDGNYYYYLPWAHTKPVVTLTSFWEDISHRMDPLNIILAIVEKLQTNTEALKSAIQTKMSEDHVAKIWLKLIDELMEDLSKELPAEGKQNITILDTQIQKLRHRSFKQIQEAAARMRSEATDVKATLPDIEDWLDKLMQLSEE